MNIRDIARLANVTPGTVSKVLNNYPDISENTRRHVMKIIEENQYIPRNSARSLKLAVKISQTGCIRLWQKRFLYGFTMRIIRLCPFMIITTLRIKLRNFRNY